MKYQLNLGSLTLGLFPLLSLLTPAHGNKCEPGIIIPVWMPQQDLGTLEIVGRGIVYFLAMIYMFIGVSIISERFMGAIEVITSKQKEIKIRRPNGETQTVIVRVWNETVANLTLMALGSSAPEILLSIIEIVGKDFEAGEIGPSTIVGSAAFNFFIIIAICMVAIPNGEVRKIKHLRVFIVTCSWSLFAYVWLLIILKVTSPGVVEIWEGVITLLFFFATVLTAFVADKRLLDVSKLTKSYRLNKRGVIVEGEANTELGMQLEGLNPEVVEETDEVKEFEKHRKQYVELLRELHVSHPGVELRALEALAREELFNKSPKSRAFYRIQATRKLIHGQDLGKKLHNRAIHDAMYTVVAPTEEDKFRDEHLTRISFHPAHYSVMENVGTFNVTVVRASGDLKDTVLVDYKTEDGTASAKDDYIPTNGVLTFGPGETTKEINIQVLDDDVFEEDEHFYIRLSNARFTQDGHMNGVGHQPHLRVVEIVNPSTAIVRILDDDYAGEFQVAEKEIETAESIGTLDIKITRASGARGKVLVPYTTVAGTAKSGKDYQHVEGNLKFENNETEKIISIHIMEENSYEKDVSFLVEISEPIPLGDDDTPLKSSERGTTKQEETKPDGWPKLGIQNRTQVRVKESQAFKSTVDILLQRDSTAIVVGTSSWKEQFMEAITLDGGEPEDGGENKRPSCGDYIVHIITVFWKVLFAFVPPTSILDGYLTFVVSIIVIGILTAFIGDIASHLGCTVGLKDSVTAIVLVALGTSVPDTFASKVAAVQDEYADASIGNVTGSNAVNVFLGIGIAWTLAAVVKAYRTCAPDMPDCHIFKVDPGSLGFSVSLFCACAVVGIIVMMIRRLRIFGGGELGGPAKFKYPSGLIFLSLWVFYVVISSMEAYELIEGF